MTASGAPTGSEVRSIDGEFDRSVSARFPAAIESPGSARHFARDVLRQWGCYPEARDDAELVVTELAANAVLHAHSPFSLRLHARGRIVRIAVHDAMPIDPTLLVVRPRRGLGLVAGVSREWGVDVRADSKTVWAEIEAMQLG